MKIRARNRAGERVNMKRFLRNGFLILLALAAAGAPAAVPPPAWPDTDDYVVFAGPPTNRRTGEERS